MATSAPASSREHPEPPADLPVLEDIQTRVLWLATRIVDDANHDRATGDGVKVGGHQASSASLVTRHDRPVFRTT